MSSWKRNLKKKDSENIIGNQVSWNSQTFWYLRKKKPAVFGSWLLPSSDGACF